MSSSTTDPGDRSSAQIEREVEGSRARLSETLDALRDQVSPGHLMDQAVEYVRGSGGADFAQNLGRSVRDNPLPVLLIGAGIGWLLLSGSKSSESSTTEPRRALPAPGTSYSPVTEGGVTRVHEGSRSSNPSLAERAGAAASGVSERVGDAADQAYQSVAGAAGSVADSISSTAGNVTQRATELGHDLRDHASRAGGSAQQGLGWMLQEQPLVLGAIGVALGAAVGALLPGTRTEDRLMGETSDSLTRQVKTVAQESYERVQEVAGEQLDHAKSAVAETYNTTKDRLDQAGISPGKIGDALGAVAQDVRQSVRDGAQSVAGEARDAINKADPAKGTST